MAEIINSTTMFGQWLRQRRRSLDLTQTDLAQRIGCSVVTIRKIETGERRPSRQMAKLMAELVGIPSKEQMKFIEFARSGYAPDHFRHPLLNRAKIEPSDAPEEMFPVDAPGWVKITHTVPPQQFAQTLLIMQVQTAPVDSPRSEELEDGRALCKIYAKGVLTGDLEGVLTQEISHFVQDYRLPETRVRMATFFNIETEHGILKGYYTGFTTDKRNSIEEQVRLHGQILFVTPAYADLFLADVYYEGDILYPTALSGNGTQDRGLLTILPR